MTLLLILAGCFVPDDEAKSDDDDDDRDDDGYDASIDCDDEDATVNGGAEEVWYDGIDQDCDGTDDDQDQDGSLVAEDCDDTDPTRSPDFEEVWYDGIDQDCDGTDDDQDQDGSPVAEDCDDTDPTRSPDFGEVWYDGIDQDCDGRDDDQDGDGSLVAEDCDDTDPARSPEFEEVWYDGVDDNCDGNDDDQDGDGYALADDCDDLDDAVSPGSEEIWYDGLDQDCDGNDDDQDEDGYSLADDCDDEDAATHPGADEYLGDGDTDCEGSDLAAFQSMTTSLTSNAIGPRVGEGNGYVVLTVQGDGCAESDYGCWLGIMLDAADPLIPSPTEEVLLTADEPGVPDDAFDFSANDDWMVFALGIEWEDGEAGHDVFATALDWSGNLGYFRGTADYTGEDFDDIEMVPDTGGAFHIAACDETGVFPTWLRGSADDFRPAPSPTTRSWMDSAFGTSESPTTPARTTTS